MVESNSRQGKHREFENVVKTKGIWKFFERKMKPRKYAEKKLLGDVYGFIFDVQNVIKIHRENWNYTGKTQGILLSEMSENHV